MNRAAFEEHVVALMQPLYYVACTLLPGKADREDALQNCLEKGLIKCEGLRDPKKLKPWITRILINECYSLLRGKKRLILVDDLPVTPSAEIDVSLRDAVLALPEKERLPFMLQLEGYTVREISTTLRVPEGTVKFRLRAAKAALRTQLLDGEEVLS